MNNNGPWPQASVDVTKDNNHHHQLQPTIMPSTGGDAADFILRRFHYYQILPGIVGIPTYNSITLVLLAHYNLLKANPSSIPSELRVT
jgi:hypothetical protein